jgi:hypothetical protein
MYPVVLFLHSWVRWIVVISAAVAVVRAFYGWLGKQGWAKLDERLGLLFSTSLDVQMLFGPILYIFLSPITQAAFKNLVRRCRMLRCASLPPNTSCICFAVVLGHVGRAVKATEPVAKHRGGICSGWRRWQFARHSLGRPLFGSARRKDVKGAKWQHLNRLMCRAHP